jgi:hypothetical protein
MIDSFVSWLATTNGSIALHESLYMYAIIETLHVVAIALFVGSIAMIDLRVLGLALARVPVSQALRQILPWTVAGFIVLLLTGTLLFYAIPERTFHSPWFRAKMILLVLAGLNVWRFHRAYGLSPAGWDTGPAPARARASAMASLALWIGVIICGRFIAYNWFDCDKPQPAFISAFSACRSYTP